MFCFNSSKEAFCLNAAFHTLLASFYILLKYNPEIIKRFPFLHKNSQFIRSNNLAGIQYNYNVW